jgi:hypothetical protein
MVIVDRLLIIDGLAGSVPLGRKSEYSRPSLGVDDFRVDCGRPEIGVVQEGLDHADVRTFRRRSVANVCRKRCGRQFSTSACFPHRCVMCSISRRLYGSPSLLLCFLDGCRRSQAWPRRSVRSSTWANSSSFSAGCIGVTSGLLPFPIVRITPGNATTGSPWRPDRRAPRPERSLEPTSPGHRPPGPREGRRSRSALAGVLPNAEFPREVGQHTSYCFILPSHRPVLPRELGNYDRCPSSLPPPIQPLCHISHPGPDAQQHRVQEVGLPLS